MAKLIIIRGIPGSGKSTFAKQLMKHYPKNEIEHFESDQFFMDNGVYKFDFQKLPTAHLVCLRNTQDALLNDKTVIVSNTFTTRKEMKPYLKFAEENNIETIIYRCTGNYQNQHGVPVETLEKMKRNLENNPFDGEIFV